MKKRRQKKPTVDILTCTCVKTKRQRKDVENIGEFSLADIKSGISAIKKKVGTTYANVQAAQKVRKAELEKERKVEQRAYHARAARKDAEQAKYGQEQRAREEWDSLSESEKHTREKRARDQAIQQARENARQTRTPLPQKIPIPNIEPPVPRRPDVDLKSEWKDTKYATKQWAKRQVTPGGMVRTAKGVGDAALKGMNWLEEKRVAALAAQKEERRLRLEAWSKLPQDRRDELLRERYERKELEHKLKQMRLSASEYHADKSMAAITGQNFRPRTFKVVTDGGRYGDDETKYFDEYGREVEGVPEEVTRKKRSSRSESSEVANLFGASYVPKLSHKEYTSSTGYESLPRQRSRRGTGIESSSPPQISRRSEADDFRRLLTRTKNL